MGANILGTGQYLPKRQLTNHEISEWLDTSDEWIMQRVGISSRHISSSDESAAFMALQAAKEAIEVAGIQLNQIDLVLVSTSTSDFVMPSLACEVQGQLGITNHCPAFDVNSACGGFLYGLNIVEQFFKAGTVKNILLICVERMSRVLDWQDRKTCVLFGDGASAVVLGEGQSEGLIASHVHADGSYRDQLYIGNNLPLEVFDKESSIPMMSMQGNTVFKKAVSMLSEIVDEILLANNIAKSDIDWLIPHQANERILKATAKRFGLPMEKVILTLKTHGNTSAASVPLALDTAIKDGRIQRGDLLVFEAFGAGFVWGSALLRY